MPTLLYASETWTEKDPQKSRIQVVDRRYLRCTCGLNRMDGEINKNVQKKFGMSFRSEKTHCRVAQVI